MGTKTQEKISKSFKKFAERGQILGKNLQNRQILGWVGSLRQIRKNIGLPYMSYIFYVTPPPEDNLFFFRPEKCPAKRRQPFFFPKNHKCGNIKNCCYSFCFNHFFNTF